MDLQGIWRFFLKIRLRDMFVGTGGYEIIPGSVGPSKRSVALALLHCCETGFYKTIHKRILDIRDLRKLVFSY